MYTESTITHDEESIFYSTEKVEVIKKSVSEIPHSDALERMPIGAQGDGVVRAKRRLGFCLTADPRPCLLMRLEKPHQLNVYRKILVWHGNRSG